MKGFFLRPGMVGILLILLVFAFIGCTSKGGHEEAPVDARKQVFDKPEYVGAEKCKSCHWREHDSWKHTLHSKFVQPVNEFTVIGDFTRNNELTVKGSKTAPGGFAGKSITSRMHIVEGTYYVNTIGPDGISRDYEIVNVVGINRRQNYVTKFPNGGMYVLPVEWDTKENVWTDYNGMKDHYPGDGKFWSDTGRLWQYNCGSCHVTGLKVNYDEGADSFDTTWVDLGIGCEACHGPGNNHIKAAKVYFDKEKDQIINPAKLPWKLRAMVCGQCHSWGSSSVDIASAKEGFPKKYSYAKGFKPGQSLNLFYVDNPETDKKHHQQYNEWEESVHAEAGVNCTTCHGVHQEGMHKSPNKSQTKAPADTLCTGCHKTLQKRAAHRIHTYGSCVACHMPKTVGHEHSHTFKFISPEVSLKAGGVKNQPNSCSSCHHHKDTPLVNLIEFLDAVKKQDMPKPFAVHSR